MFPRTKAIVWCLLLMFWQGQAAASNSTEDAQKKALESYVLKINFECGMNLAMEYDHASLKSNNKDIERGQTGGDNQCNEPLRYIWYACKSAAGKAALKKLAITKVVCRGVAGKTGKLARSGSTITVDRAYEESNSYVLSLKQFQAATKLTFKMKDEDPYHDNDWSVFGRKVNPVTDAKSYCLVDGQKKTYEDYSSISNGYGEYSSAKKSQCWNEGALVLELQKINRKHTGNSTNFRDDTKQVSTYKDNKRHGDQKDFVKNKLKSHDLYNMDKQVWRKEYFDSGKLKSYHLYLASGYVDLEFHEDGKIGKIDCKPELKSDPLFTKLCGFGKVNTVKTYDSSGKVQNTFVFKDGVLQSQKGGEGYNAKSDVKYKDGKKDGLEKFAGKNGKLSGTVVWKNGVKDGPEKDFHTDGKKIIKLTNWKNDKVTSVTDYYLNGNPKKTETFESDKRKKSQDYYDNGKLQYESTYVKCRSWKGWCEDGVQKRFEDTGKKYSEETYKEGKRSGTSKFWHSNGKIYRNLEYVDDKVRSSREYKSDGKLVESVEYEEDGSKKVKKK